MENNWTINEHIGFRKNKNQISFKSLPTSFKTIYTLSHKLESIIFYSGITGLWECSDLEMLVYRIIAREGLTEMSFSQVTMAIKSASAGSIKTSQESMILFYQHRYIGYKNGVL